MLETAKRKNSVKKILLKELTWRGITGIKEIKEFCDTSFSMSHAERITSSSAICNRSCGKILGGKGVGKGDPKPRNQKRWKRGKKKDEELRGIPKFIVTMPKRTSETVDELPRGEKGQVHKPTMARIGVWELYTKIRIIWLARGGSGREKKSQRGGFKQGIPLRTGEGKNDTSRTVKPIFQPKSSKYRIKGKSNFTPPSLE